VEVEVDECSICTVCQYTDDGSAQYSDNEISHPCCNLSRTRNMPLCDREVVLAEEILILGSL